MEYTFQSQSKRLGYQDPEREGGWCLPQGHNFDPRSHVTTFQGGHLSGHLNPGILQKGNRLTKAWDKPGLSRQSLSSFPQTREQGPAGRERKYTIQSFRR